MLEASQKGLSTIDYSILSTADGWTTDNNNFNFIFHNQWLVRDNSDIVVKLEYKNSVDLYLNDKVTKLVWYEKDSFERGLDWFSGIFGSKETGNNQASDKDHCD